LSRALEAGVAAARAGAPPAEVVAQTRAGFAAAGVVPDYVALVDPDTFESPAEPPAGDAIGAILLVAAPIGSTRLIDNKPVALGGTGQPNRDGSS
jgi:pantoate--beta-alanine ligase